MPFTLAHPAAVLPLRRFCPRALSFPALVAGSMSPDAGYGLQRWGLDKVSHGPLGSLLFSLPAGLVLLSLFYWLRLPLARLLPAGHREAFLALSARPAGSAGVVVYSVLLGVWTHLFWDAFTNNHGWFAEHLELLQAPLFFVGSHAVRVCHLLWYACSGAGVAALFLAYDRWRRELAGGSSATPSRPNWGVAAFVGLGVLPIGMVHHRIPGLTGFLLVAGLSGLLIAAAVGGSRRTSPGPGAAAS